MIPYQVFCVAFVELPSITVIPHTLTLIGFAGAWHDARLPPANGFQSHSHLSANSSSIGIASPGGQPFSGSRRPQSEPVGASVSKPATSTKRGLSSTVGQTRESGNAYRAELLACAGTVASSTCFASQPAHCMASTLKQRQRDAGDCARQWKSAPEARRNELLVT